MYDFSIKRLYFPLFFLFAFKCDNSLEIVRCALMKDVNRLSKKLVSNESFGENKNEYSNIATSY